MRSDDNDPIAAALPAFISEAHEHIQRFEELLLALETTPSDREMLDALFRCAHTVKGSAGLFGLDGVVAFTHHVETLLDRLRGGAVALTPDLSTLLLQCNDQILSLVEQAEAPARADEAGRAARDALVQRLQAVPDLALEAAPRRWHVSVHFGPDVFRNGLDPLAILRSLERLGRLTAVGCDAEGVPTLQALDPERCHLGFEIALESSAGRAAIEDAFSFVRDECKLHVLDGDASATDFCGLIAAMPDNPRLGDILVSVGAISTQQLKLGLQHQAETAAREGSAPPLGQILQHTAGVQPQVVAAALEKQQKLRATRGGAGEGDETRTIRVQADRLDALITLLGELVTASAAAQLQARHTRQRGLVEANDQIGRLVEEVRNGALQLRMVPIGESFSRLRRVVRDTAAELGKDVVLEIEGAETELDKSVVERIADPLMHLVRNALDHGLEPPDEREAAGKDRRGRLLLSACHESGSILIRIRDDGRGVQRRKVLERAWARGLLPPGTVPADTEILDLIFEPGFSTAERVTNLSGRGVGMDVVRRNIEALRGSVTLSGAEGQGTGIEIRLPLTLAIIDGFLVGVGHAHFVFPLDAVAEVIEGRGADVDERGRGGVELRGRFLPVLSLRRLYGLAGPEPARSSIVVLQAGARRFGVRVDALLGQHQTVIKPLGRMFSHLRGLAGCSILANGDVALILDAVALGLRAAEPATPITPTRADPAPALQGQPS